MEYIFRFAQFPYCDGRATAETLHPPGSWLPFALLTALRLEISRRARLFFCRIESDIAWLGRFPYTRYPGAFEGPKYKKLLLGPMMSGCCCVHSASRVSLITILGVCSTCTIVNAARPSRSSILVEKGSEPN